MSHTPGPWAWWPTAGLPMRYAVGKGGETIAEIPYGDGWLRVEEREANAQLIAAVTDLLDNAKALFACAYAAHLGPTEPYHDRCDLCAILQDTDAGIRKATER